MHILWADDHALFREGMSNLLQTERPGCRVDIASSHAEVRKRLAEGLHPDILVLDFRMPGEEPLPAIRSIRASWPEIPLLVVSASDDPYVARSLRDAGANGFVPKSANANAILRAIDRILQGQHAFPKDASASPHDFTPSQLRILRLLAEGLSNREIAEKTGHTEGTVKQYVKSILDILNVDNRVQAAIRAREILGLNS